MNTNSEHEKDDHWKTIVTFSFLSEAFGMRTCLDAEGIESFIPEEFSSSINPLTTALQVRLQVRSKDVEAARAVLQSQETILAETCSRCKSGQVVRQQSPAARNWLFAIFGFLFGVPMRRPRQKWICEKCGTVL